MKVTRRNNFALQQVREAKARIDSLLQTFTKTTNGAVTLTMYAVDSATMSELRLVRAYLTDAEAYLATD